MSTGKNKILIGFLVLLIITGIYFRFTNIYSQVMNVDERVTAMRLAGHSWKTDGDFFYDGATYTGKELKEYHTLSERSKFTDTLDSLWREDTQHPPFYYLLSWLTAKLGDGSFYNARIVSAVSSCFAILSAYLLADIAFELPFSGIVAATVLALSQNQIAIANHARQFSLHTALVLFSTYLFLSILKKPSKAKLWGYTVTNIIALYTLPLAGLTLVAKAIYLWVTKQKDALVSFAVSSWSISIIAFLPWVYKIIENRKQVGTTTGWLGKGIPFEDYLTQLGRVLVNSLVFNGMVNTSLILGLFVVALLVAFNTNDKFRLIGLLGLVNIIPFLSMDIIKGGIRTLQPRYIISFQLLLVLAVAYLLVFLIQRYPYLGMIAMSLVLCFQLNSAIRYVSSNTWYTDGRAKDNKHIVNLISKEDTLLVDIEPQYPNKNFAVSLAYLLPEETKFSFYTKLNEDLFNKGDFLYNPKKRDLDKFKEKYKLTKLNKQRYVELYSINR